MHRRTGSRRAPAVASSAMCGLFLVLPGPTTGQEAGRLRLTPSVGAAIFPSNVERFVPGAVTISMDPALLVGVEAGYGVTRNWEISGFLLFARPDLDRSPAPDTRGAIDQKFWSGNLSYYLRGQSRLRPFLTAGAGATVVGSAFDEMHLAGNGGAGLLVAISRRFSLRLDARDQVSSGRFRGGTQHDVLVKVGTDFRF